MEIIKPSGTFKTTNISIDDIYPNDGNFYAMEDIESLADNILLNGLKQNLEVVEDEDGRYRLISGQRRWEALKSLVEKGHDEFGEVTCFISEALDEDEERISLIAANAYRTKSQQELVKEEKLLKESLTRLKEAGKTFKGYDLSSGRLRDAVSSILGISNTKAAQIESLNNNLSEELKEEFEEGSLTFSAAYEASGLDEEGQEEVLKKLHEDGKVTGADIKDIKNKDSRSDEDTEDDDEEIDWDEGVEEDEDGEIEYPYETPHPEGITSLCYSCTQYETCNVKTGTCTKCDQYESRKEAYKTDEQRYDEEQAKIDRQTKKRLEEMEDEARANGQNSENTVKRQIQVGRTQFAKIAKGEQPFLITKKEKYAPYKEGEVIDLIEMNDGEETGTIMEVTISSPFMDHSGLKDGWCVFGFKFETD